jgi:hypothetical protein
MILNQRILDYFNDNRNYKAHYCDHMRCSCPPNGMYWREYDEWIRLGRPYTLDEAMVEKMQTTKQKSRFEYDKYILGFLTILFLFFVGNICQKLN